LDAGATGSHAIAGLPVTGTPLNVSSLMGEGAAGGAVREERDRRRRHGLGSLGEGGRRNGPGVECPICFQIPDPHFRV